MRFSIIKKIIAAAMAAVFCISMAGCSGQEKQVTAEDVLAEETAAESDVNESHDKKANTGSGNIEFAWWGSDARHEYTKQAIDKFHEKNKGITVMPNYSAFDSYEGFFAQSVASGSLPDLMAVNYNWLYEYTKGGSVFADLKDYADELSLSSYSEDALQLCTLNDRLIGLPVSRSVQTCFYNKTIYDKYGLAVPKTFEDLYAAAEAMKADGIYPISFNSKSGYMAAVSYAEQLSGHTYMSLEGEIGFDENDIKNMLQFYKDLIDKDVCCRVESYDKTMITEGTTAGLMAWNSDGGAWYDAINAGNEVVVGDYLSVDGKENPILYSKPGSLYCISANSENIDAAVTLLRFVASSPEMMELQQTERGVPANQDAQGYLLREGSLEDSIEYEAEVKAHEYTNLQQMSYFMEDSGIVKLYWEAANAVSFDEKTADAAAKDLLNDMKSLMETKR